MILEQILCAVKDRLMSSGFFTQFYEYCSLVQDGTVTKPMYYIGKGEKVPVMDFDRNGSGYMRSTGPVRVSVNTSFPEVTACQDDLIVDLVYPLRLVAAVPKEKLSDNAYSTDYLYYQIMGVLAANYNIPDVIDVRLSERSYTTDALTIWRSEVSGQDYQMLFSLAYLSIDFELKITAKKTCLIEDCAYGY